MEMLRILSMMMVLTVHFAGATFGLPTPGELYGGEADAALIGKTVLEALAITGVNCFVLISGYYGIRASWRGLIRFTLWCLSASLIVYAVKCAEKGGLADGLTEALLVYSATDLWFVPAYLALYLMSPFLNGGFRSLSGRQSHWVLAGLLFLNVYLGWAREGRVNPTGYNEMQMILMYYIGWYLRRHEKFFGRFKPRTYAAVYLLSAAAVAATLNFAYNNPLVIVESAALFLAFARMKPRSLPAVDWVASSAFMVYLLHKSPYMWLKLRGTLLAFDASYSGAAFAGACVALFCAVFAGSILIDKIRIAVGRYFKSLLRI